MSGAIHQLARVSRAPAIRSVVAQVGNLAFADNQRGYVTVAGVHSNLLEHGKSVGVWELQSHHNEIHACFSQTQHSLTSAQRLDDVPSLRAESGGAQALPIGVTVDHEEGNLPPGGGRARG